MGDIEIGLSIKTNIYLHVADNKLPTAFNVDCIKSIEDCGGASLVICDDCPECANDSITSAFVVKETVGEITASVEEANGYKNKLIEYVESLLKNKDNGTE